ncbi:hypothetical protein [Xanthobacter variabilis]|uniref:hypothetical protein n=1 Tax=Xanthobacter variabilis TaxID=3119932 RepID=UPI00374E356B
MIRRPVVAICAILALGGAARGAGDPGIMGTWSTNCRKLPVTETLHVDIDSVQLGDRHCVFVDWKNTVVGSYSPLACSTEGQLSIGHFLVQKKSPTQIAVDFDGLNETLSRCDAPRSPTAAAPNDISARLNGDWARDRKACELYRSGEFDKPGYDIAALSRFGVATFENGKFEMLASPIRCQISQSDNSGSGKYSISAQCQVKDYPTRPATGAITFRQSGAANLELHGAGFGLIQLIKCDRE